MKSDLQLVTEAYELERKSLRLSIKESLSEGDYLQAYYYDGALGLVNTCLHALYSFRDPLFILKEEVDLYERTFLRQAKNRFDKKLRKAVEESWIRHIEIKQEVIAKLEKEPKKPFYDDQHIDDALFDLYEGKCHCFRFIVDDLVEMKFLMQGKILTITLLSPGNIGEPDFVVDKRVPDPFAGIGFVYDAELNGMAYHYDMVGFNDAWPIKIMLSRLMFDVLHLYDIHQPARLLYEG